MEKKKNLFSVQKTPSPYSPCVPLPSAAPLQTLTTTRQGSGCRGLRSWRSTEQPRTRLAPALSEPGGSSSAVWAARRFSRRTETFRQNHTRPVASSSSRAQDFTPNHGRYRQPLHTFPFCGKHVCMKTNQGRNLILNCQRCSLNSAPMSLLRNWKRARNTGLAETSHAPHQEGDGEGQGDSPRTSP